MKLLIFDSSALIYRAFYALPPLTDPSGRVVNAVYGFTSAVINITKNINPTHIIFAFDSPKPTFRAEKYKEYKATRTKAPDELYAQIPLTKELVEQFGFLSFEKAGFEADDIIGTSTRQFIKDYPEGEVVIATGDLDTLQLISPKVKVYALSRGISEAKMYNEKEVKMRFGLEPHQMNDFKGLRGDASDNVKGVKGIGPKTASELLQTYHTLEGIYANLDKLKPRIKEILEENKDQALLSKELVTLDCDVPIEINWQDGIFETDQLEAGKKHLEDYSFTSLINRIEKWQQELKVPSQKLKVESIEEKIALKNDISVINSLEELENRVKNALNTTSDVVAWFGKSSFGEGLGLGIVDKGSLKESFFIKKNLIEKFSALLWKEIMVWVFDSKEIYKGLFPHRDILEKSQDLKLEAYLIQPINMRKFSFKEVAWFFAKTRWEEPKQQLSLLLPEDNSLNLSKVNEILAILATLQKEISGAFVEQVQFQKESNFLKEIFPVIKDKIKEKDLDFIYKEIESPLAKVLGMMEMSGIKIDLELLEILRQKNQVFLTKLKEEIFALSGKEFNLDSPSQLADVLFEDLGISSFVSKKGKSGHFSTKADVLEKLAGTHPIIPFLLEFRERRKFQTTYLDVIPKLVNQETKRLYTSFEQTGTTTGRLSSNNPNLQNIPKEPIDKENNLGLRHIFVAEEGFQLVSLDYSQIEVRIAAYLTGEKKLIESFERGEDIHRKTAALVNNLPPKEVTDELRNSAKALNFGIIYGISSFGFAKSTKMGEREAKIFIDNYLEEFPLIAKYMEETKKFARINGYVETIFGRRRYVPEASLENRILRQAGERMAINMPLQGTAADIMKLALVRVGEYLEEKYEYSKIPLLERDVRLLLSIHDEIILEVRNNLVEGVVEKIQEIMENVAKEILPLKVNVGIGKNWGDL